MFIALSEKAIEPPASDWFVENFEQIDGDVLNSKSQNKPGFKKVLEIYFVPGGFCKQFLRYFVNLTYSLIKIFIGDVY
mgnify:CR=1 FL=1